jgi:hypothetical protein
MELTSETILINGFILTDGKSLKEGLLLVIEGYILSDGTMFVG